MENNTKSTVSTACRMVLRPLASILLKCGMTWREFSELSKSVFVQAASEEFGIRGRPTNVSRVSILTGIGRKEVKRQRELLKSSEPPAKGKTTDATRVLSGWFQDAEFLNGAEPMLLEEHGEGASFESLCDRYSGDIAPQTMLKELLHTETIERTASGQLRVKRRFYQPARHEGEHLIWGMKFMKDAADTMNNNVFLSNGAKPRFRRKAENVRIASRTVPEFREYLDKRGQEFLEEIDGWLTNNEEADDSNKSEFVRIGVGLFAIEDSLHEEKKR